MPLADDWLMVRPEVVEFADVELVERLVAAAFDAELVPLTSLRQRIRARVEQRIWEW